MWTWRSLKLLGWLFGVILRLNLYILLQSRFRRVFYATKLIKFSIRWVISLLFLSLIISFPLRLSKHLFRRSAQNRYAVMPN